MKKLLFLSLLVIAGKFASAQCDAQFIYNVQSTTPPSVQFWDSSSSSSPIVSWLWDFGDGTTDSIQFPPQHTYPAAGSYVVCLAITDSLGCIDSTCANVYVGPSSPTLTLYHLMVDSMNLYNCTSPASVGFYYSAYAAGYLSTDSLLFQVSYGDGVDSSFYLSLSNTQFSGYLYHQYQNGGNYTAQMIITAPDSLADTVQSQTVIVASTCGNVSGTVYEDNNNNCVNDFGDLLLPDISVQLNLGTQLIAWTTTDANGFYSFNVPTGNAYDIIIHPSNNFYAHYSASCPTTGIITIAGAPSSGNDFGVICPPGYDLTGSITGWGFRPGFTGSACVSIFNMLCNTPSGQAQLVFGPSVTPLPDSGGAGYTVNGNTVTFTFNSPDLYWHFCIPVLVSTSAQIGDSVCIVMTILPTAGDSVPSNNTGTFCFVIRGSWDPNDKNVNPTGDGLQGYIRPNTDLTYTIRFQNTGTAEAFNIFILDTLDASLDASSVEILGTSHDMHWTLLAGNILRFNYDNIMLPDSNTNEPASHGYVTYRIKQVAGVAHFAEITNTADIYFDFNQPVITNTVLNTVDHFLSVIVCGFPSLVMGYPNPAHDKFFMRFNDQELKTILVLDVLGKVVHRNNSSAESYILNTSEFTEGIYTIQVTYNRNRTDAFKMVVKH